MNDIFTKNNIKLNVKADTKDEAIRMAGEILVERGYVEASYLDAMYDREEAASTYMGNYVAIPHGTDDAKDAVLKSGLSLLQIPEGVSFGEDKEVKLVIGIAGKNNEHLELLQKIALVCSDVSRVEELVEADTEEAVLDLFDQVEA
ncbi:MAG TPA: PTS sugar transporter subunit IIA [Bacillales bacterium]|nr:PTS sugar transporter subunit IIA [Bacillales bacterium]